MMKMWEGIQEHQNPPSGLTGSKEKEGLVKERRKSRRREGKRAMATSAAEKKREIEKSG